MCDILAIGTHTQTPQEIITMATPNYSVGLEFGQSVGLEDIPTFAQAVKVAKQSASSMGETLSIFRNDIREDEELGFDVVQKVTMTKVFPSDEAFKARYKPMSAEYLGQQWQTPYWHAYMKANGMNGSFEIVEYMVPQVNGDTHSAHFVMEGVGGGCASGTLKMVKQFIANAMIKQPAGVA